MMVRMPVILQRAPELQVTRGHVNRCLYLGIVPNCGQFFQVIQSALQLLVASHHVGTGYRVYLAVDKRQRNYRFLQGRYPAFTVLDAVSHVGDQVVKNMFAAV